MKNAQQAGKSRGSGKMLPDELRTATQTATPTQGSKSTSTPTATITAMPTQTHRPRRGGLMAIKCAHKRWLILYPTLLLVLMLLIGCVTHSSNTSQEFEKTSPAQVLHPTLIENIPTLTLTATNPGNKPTAVSTREPTQANNPSFCDWPPIEVSGSSVRQFTWYDHDSKILYRLENEAWYLYDLATKENSLFNGSLPDDQTEARKIAEKFGVDHFYDIFLSPDGKMVIYSDNKIPGGYEIFQKSLGEKESFSIGEIKGQIDRFFWMEHKNQAILSIDWQSPMGVAEAYVYLLKLDEGKIEILIPNNPEFENLSLFSRSPQGSLLLFVLYSGHDRFVRTFNLQTQEIQKTKLWHPWEYQWLPDRQELLVVGKLNPVEPYFAYTYDINKDTLEVLSKEPLNIAYGLAGGVIINPNGKFIAFVESETHKLFLLNCSRTSKR
jgi:hypothetical protein